MKRVITTVLRQQAILSSTLHVPQFDAVFPNVIKHVNRFEEYVKVGISQDEFLAQNEVFHAAIEPEIVNALPEWRNLAKMNYKRVCFHILRVLYCLLRAPEFRSFLPAERNFMFWVAMLHDVCKRGIPILPTAKDPFHPFASAAYALEYLAALCGAGNQILSKVNNVSGEIRRAKYSKMITFYDMKWNRDNTVGLECSDLSKLGQLLSGVDEVFAPRSFHNDVVRLVMLHQCVPTIEKFRFNNQIEPEEVATYVDRRLLRYLKLFTECDSNSYLLNINRHLIPVHKKEFDSVFMKYEKMCPENL